MKTSVVLVSPAGKSPFVGQGTGYLGRTLLRKFIRKLDGAFSEGAIGRLVYRPYVAVGTQCANAVVTCATVVDGNTVTINGTAITAGTGTTGNNQFDDSLATDILVAGDLVRAINASTTSLISDHVHASNKRAIITCATVVVNDYVEIDGVRLYAKAGTVGTVTGLLINEFCAKGSGTDTQTATSLLLAINNHPTLSQIVYAVSSGAVVTVYERPPSTSQTIPISTSSGSTLAITGSATTLATSAGVFIESILPGVAGNAVTLATSGGTLAITFDNSGRLKNGTSTTYTY